MRIAITRRVTLAAATALVAVGAGAATATALSGSEPSVDRAVAVDPVADVPVAPAPYYSAVERSTQKPTARIAEGQKILAARFPDLAGRDLRGLKAADGTQAWVVSGSKHTCLGADNSDGTGFACAPNGDAKRGISVAEVRKDSGERSVTLLPDDIGSVTADGRVSKVSGNLVVVEHRGQAVLQANPSDGRASFRVGTE